MKREEGSMAKEGYIPLNYIESVGSQYIDTRVLDGENLDFEIVIKQKDTNTAYMFFGARYGNRNDEETLLWAPSNSQARPLRLGYKSTWYTTALTREEWHAIKMSGNILYIDGTQAITFTKSPFTRKYSVFLFAANIAGSASYCDLICYSSAKMYENGVLVRDYVPMMRISDSKPGLYDLCESICPLTNTPFYINAGSGEFQYQ